MKLGSLIALQNSGALEKLKTIEMDGKRTLKLRRIIRDVLHELEPVNEALREYVKKHGKNNRLDPADPETISGWLKMQNEMSAEECDITIDPVIEIDELPKVTAVEIDALIECGLIEDDKT